MKIKNSFITSIVCGAIFLAISAGQSLAGGWCDSAIVTQTGADSWDTVEGSNNKIWVTCDGQWNGEERIFYFLKDNGVEENHLAVALTAMSLKHKVKLYISGNAANNSLIKAIYLLDTTY